MNKAVRGVIHVHSDFSRDGLCSIAFLADFARGAGFQFVGLTDHAEDLTVQDMECLRRECEDHSDESFVVIPGLEFACSGDIHILGLGISEAIPSIDPMTVSRHIRSLNGLVVLAHPCRNAHDCPQELRGVLHGIEIWNAAYDGQIVPPLANLRLLQEARNTNPAISGFGGADLHLFDQPLGVTLELDMNGPTPIAAGIVLDRLRAGSFRMRGRYLVLEAHPTLTWRRRSWIWACRNLYDIGRVIRGAGALKA